MLKKTILFKISIINSINERERERIITLANIKNIIILDIFVNNLFKSNQIYFGKNFFHNYEEL